MIRCRLIAVWCVVLVSAIAPRWGHGDELFPPAERIRHDRPRVLLRPAATPHAISLAALRSQPRDDEFDKMLAQLRRQDDAASGAMVWLLTGETEAADKAVRRMRAYTFPGRVDTFHIYFRLHEFALAYDWLHDYPGFSDEAKREVRTRVLPLAEAGLRQSNDHVFHNYIWMSAGGTALWALATVGEDDAADRLYEQIARRFNRGLFPAMRYLDGLPSEPMGYWALYDLTPCAQVLLAAGSASESDPLETIRTEQDDWLNRHFDNLIHSTLPNMRYIPWGDLQSGPNGGVTFEMAGAIDAMTWGLDSPHGAWFSRWLAARRGLQRFYGETAVYFMLYRRATSTQPSVPPLSFLAGNRQSGHFIARSGWDDSATIVALRATDHFGDHNHYDQGGFLIYRNGLLAVDPPVYNHIRGPQQLTEHHNTLLLGGQPQRPARGQWFTTVEKFKENLSGGQRLETGDMTFNHDSDRWAAASCQFAQAYEPEVVASCVRQLLFVRPGAVVIVDRLAAPAGGELPEVEWLLQLPAAPHVEKGRLWATNGKSWIRYRTLLPDGPVPEVTATPVRTHRASFRYDPAVTLTTVHLLEVGDGTEPDPSADVGVQQADGALEITLHGTTYRFAAEMPFAVTAR